MTTTVHPGTAPALDVSTRLRLFTHEGRLYGHSAAVPLVYLSCGPALGDLLRSPMVDPSPAVAPFVRALHRAGVLVDPHAPDPVHEARGRPDAVRELTLFPTSSCNLRCTYCHATSGPGAGPRMSVDTALTSIDAFYADLDDRVEAVALQFHGGGEPTTNLTVMSRAWEHFRAGAASRGLRVRVATITNGTFGPPALRLLSDEPWSVMVSYDGPRQSAQRPTAAGADSRARVVANIRALVEAGRPVTIRATLTRDGLGALPDLVEEAAALGVRALQVEPSSTVGRGATVDGGAPDPAEFAFAYLAAFDLGLRRGVRVETAAWTTRRIGDGHFCGAQTGLTQVTPDGFVSCCTEVTDGSDPDDPFIVGTVDPSRRLQITPVRRDAMAARIGYAMAPCSSCAFVDTCAGGCASRARAQTGDLHDRDLAHCAQSKIVNAAMIASIADGRISPDAGWQPLIVELSEDESGIRGMEGRLVALVPPAARRRWNADPARRPFLPAPADPNPFFHLPPPGAPAPH